MKSYMICLSVTSLFTEHKALKFHPYCSMCQNFLLLQRLNNVSLCVHSTFFFLPFINLGYFYLLALVENAVMNMDVQMSLWNSAFSSSGYITRSEISGSYGILFLIFWGISILFPTAAVPFYIPTNCVQQLLFPHILTNTDVLFSAFFFNSSHPNWVCNVISLWFWFAFPPIGDLDISFMCFLAIWVSSLE